MRKAAILGVTAGLFIPAQAAAQAPPALWQQETQAAAVDYWEHAAPFIATETTVNWTYGPIPENAGAVTALGSTQATITINTNNDWTAHSLCIASVHEYGHVILGPTAFAATNPSDPSHSADPNNIMSSSSSIYSLDIPQCRETPTAAPTAAPTVSGVTVQQRLGQGKHQHVRRRARNHGRNWIARRALR